MSFPTNTSPNRMAYGNCGLLSDFDKFTRTDQKDLALPSILSEKHNFSIPISISTEKTYS